MKEKFERESRVRNLRVKVESKNCKEKEGEEVERKINYTRRLRMLRKKVERETE